MLASKQARALATRGRILKEATRLFALKGYHDSKLDEIVRAAKVTSGAFFHHFRSKEELAFAVMDSYADQRRHELAQIEHGLRETHSGDPFDAVCRWLDATQERFRRRAERKEAGCIFGNLSTALADTHNGFRQRLAQAFERMAADFKTRLDACAQSCQTSRQVDTLELARYIVAVIEGSIILARANQEPRFLTSHFQLLKNHLRHVFAVEGQLTVQHVAGLSRGALAVPVANRRRRRNGEVVPVSRGAVRRMGRGLLKRNK